MTIITKSLLARLGGYNALSANERELVAVPLDAACPAERTVGRAKQRVGLGFEVRNGKLAGASRSQTKQALGSGDSVDAAFALRAARLRRIPL